MSARDTPLLRGLDRDDLRSIGDSCSRTIISSETDAPTPPERGVFALSTNPLGRVRDLSASAGSITRSLSRGAFSLSSALEPRRNGRRGMTSVSSSAGAE